MKSMVMSLAGGLNHVQNKQAVSNQQRVRGIPGRPEAPRDLQVQPAAGGVLVTWKLPQNHDRVAGYRIYINNESNLFSQIRDKGTRQIFVPLGSGASPTAVNIMVSSFTTLGRESAKIITPGMPIAQALTTAVPTVPPGYADEGPAGKNRGLIRFQGETQYIR